MNFTEMTFPSFKNLHKNHGWDNQASIDVHQVTGIQPTIHIWT